MPIRRSKHYTAQKLRDPDKPLPKVKARWVAEALRKSKAAKAHRTAESALKYINKDGSVAVDAVAESLGLTKASLASALGLAEETLQRSARANAPKTRQRLREMLDILSRVEPWAGSWPQAWGWYRGQGIPALGEQTAEALVKTGQADLVREYLDAYAAGAFA